jgi:excisionase family DNA binding protein
MTVTQLELPLAGAPPSSAVPSGYLTIAEAAERVRCCERRIRRAIESGALRAGRIRGERGSRGGYRIRPADLDAWLFDDAA